MASFEALEVLFQQGVVLSEYLSISGEPSYQVFHDSQFRKTLLLAAASRFEAEVQGAVVDFATESASGSVEIVALIKSKAVERQYHTYFDWKGSNANQFFGLFGDGCKQYAKGIIAAEPALASSVKAFLELGHLRNQLVHVDFVTFPLEKTPTEIFSLFREGTLFVSRIPTLLRRGASASSAQNVAA